MNENLLSTTLMSACIVLVGCATTSTPATYDNTHSRAFNIAQAGGLYEVKDRIVPRAEYESLEFTGNTATNTLLFTSSLGANIDLGAGLGVGLLTSVLEQPGTASRNSVVAWMPESEAATSEEAQARLVSQMKVAMENTLKEMGLSYEVTNGNSERKVEFYFHNEEFGCPEYQQGMTNKELCYIATEIFEPRKAASPSFVSSAQNSYAFESNHKVYYHRFRVTPGRDSNVPTDQMYAAVSSKLPEWVYLYIASGQIKINDTTVTTPYLLEQGKAHLFIHPEES
ncbi:hypothetical protein JKP10_18080 [Vibrio vulnificus]|uniref:hypothetical protein n=1 Tax=Vibrio vulnificus TaxID=672 RepID=UPI0010297A4B|nr:hypothetical protein [Vibrio vulnificus]EGQ8902390.1 hypothetical protein [Vibrio parahaemolyticus]EGW0146040.1 hypothetical protein [Vibrio parahaemolyticus]EJC7147382.1 hypothetical protein [Vibrio parahaemolyticus]EJG0501809.1 hypothetical protein [Vibrio parahaemolyticus]MCA4001355.1 hypothetical protein [Vibrio vulnificus]